MAGIRSWLRAFTERHMGRCRVCGSAVDVMCYDPRGLWAFFWRKTYCPKHCPEHEFAYQRDMREWGCNICGEPASTGFLGIRSRLERNNGTRSEEEGKTRSEGDRQACNGTCNALALNPSRKN